MAISCGKCIFPANVQVFEIGNKESNLKSWLFWTAPKQLRHVSKMWPNHTISTPFSYFWSRKMEYLTSFFITFCNCSWKQFCCYPVIGIWKRQVLPNYTLMRNDVMKCHAYSTRNESTFCTSVNWLVLVTTDNLTSNKSDRLFRKLF